jgi:hypothetical protein
VHERGRPVLWLSVEHGLHSVMAQLIPGLYRHAHHHHRGSGIHRSHSHTHTHTHTHTHIHTHTHTGTGGAHARTTQRMPYRCSDHICVFACSECAFAVFHVSDFVHTAIHLIIILVLNLSARNSQQPTHQQPTQSRSARAVSSPPHDFALAGRAFQRVVSSRCVPCIGGARVSWAAECSHRFR